MRLRLIILVLALLAFVSASAGGYLYYASLKEAAFEEAERQAAIRIELIGKSLSSYLSENIKSVKALAGMEEMLEMLVRPGKVAQHNSNKMLDLFKASLEVDVCYLMDHEGNTVASSNRDAPDSFVGKNFAFRPYFQQAIHSAPSTYLALGTTSNKRGVYHSFPVFEKGEDLPIGLVVIKASIDQIEKRLNLSGDEMLLVTDPSGVIFISNRKDWLFHSIYELSRQEKEKIKASRQFGNGPWDWVGLTFSEEKLAEDREGNHYLVHQSKIENYEGWQFIHLRNRKAVSDIVTDPIVRIMGPAVLALCALLGVSIIFLYRKASHEIFRRKSAESALRKSEERYRSIYHMAPAMLHSVNSKGRLIRVSEHWLKALGYEREEVVGKPLVDFLSKESGKYVKQTVIPDFFKTGVASDIPYEFVKQNGEMIKALVSAIGERDENGNVIRSLAVSIDVTERIKAEEDLKLAKEKLSHYSKDLERQVRKQTGEIKSILKYTPSVISIKDQKGRYVLVNSRFEELFDMSGDVILGKTDHDLFQKRLADQFRTNDLAVLRRKKASQMEEQIQQADGEHTYFSVKFPVYDEKGGITGVCGISTDITALKKAQNQLRRLSAGIMASQENERAAISRELHDELGQMLTALRMDSVWIAEHLKGSEKKVSERAISMCNLIDQTIEEVRSMAVRLRPGILDHLGLVDALEWYTADFERRTKISCVFEHSDVPDVSDVLATAAYRITQEAMTNVARHAEAKHVDVSLIRSDGHLVLSVEDDGRGFDTGKLSESEGLGVAGIRERASLVGGRVNVFSEPNKGTRVFFRVPLNIGDS
jgi:PAS domain S-box-containing protein